MTLTSEKAADDSEAAPGVAEWGPTRMRVLMERGQLREAAQLAELVIAASQSVEDVISLGNSFTAVAELFVKAGQTDRARSFYEDALAVYQAKGVRPLEIDLQSRLEQLSLQAP